jgi:hypothetical protein
MNPLTIAASDVNVLGIIVFVVWILYQLFSLGRKKEGSPQQEGSSQESGGPVDPRDELRKFFEELEKSTTTVETPQRPPTPPPIRQTPRREPPPRRPMQQRTETRPAPVRPEPPVARPVITFPEPPIPALPLKPRAVPLATTSYTPELNTPVALRKYIVATEILGKPIALRQN